jgi:phytoene synthase
MPRSTSFYFSFVILPAPQRRAITAVFDFCRAVDDCVDLESDPARAAEAVESWRAEVARLFDGQRPVTIAGQAVQPFISAYGMPRHAFDALVDGVAMDLVPRRYPTFADLELYCHRVASSVGSMCAAIFGVHGPEADQYARDLGVALQLTNILRDVGVDFQKGRCYLPTEDLERFGCSEAELAAEVRRAGQGLASDRVRSVLEHHAARARLFFDRAVRARPSGDRRRIAAAEIMRAIYRDLLRRIEAAGCDVFSSVIRVPRLAQARIALSTWWTYR